jgi:nitrite reductase (NADH) large subunit
MSWREDDSAAFSTLEPPSQSFWQNLAIQTDSHAEIVIVGAGRAGLHIAKSLDAVGRVVIFDAEPWGPYDRVMLSNLLSREVAEPDIFFDLSGLTECRNLEFVRRRVVRIEPQAKFIQSDDRRRIYYEKLVLCLGSSPRRPPIPGIGLNGVYTFRDLGDGRRLIDHAHRAHDAVIIGGGYLGLETASGLRRRGMHCAVVETQNQLMPGQLDATTANQLEAMFEDLDIAVFTGRQVQCLEGNTNGYVAAVRLDGGTTLKAEMVVVCTGVTPNTGLARDAGLDVSRGILVDDSMRTSDPFIHAVGECAEHRGRVYGLVGPVIEQAETALAALRGGASAYGGSIAASSLKIAGIELFVAGDLQCPGDQRARIVAYQDRRNRVYRALAVRDERIVGGVAIGSWSQTHRLRRAVETGEVIEKRQARRFSRNGEFWVDASGTVADWPREALICNCRLVTKAAIDVAIASGIRTREAISRSTGAAQLCGSCQPLIDELLGQGRRPARSPLLGALSLISLIVLTGLTAFLAAPPWPVSPVIANSFQIENLWVDGILKQVTGFGLAASVLIAALLFLRKHVTRGLPGSFKSWRLVHAGLGGVMTGLLFAHTGFSLGSHLNGWLMASFLATLAVGALAGLATGLEARVRSRRPGGNLSPRRAAAWLHIAAAWPLPLLLVAHILTVYYF